MKFSLAQQELLRTLLRSGPLPLVPTGAGAGRKKLARAAVAASELVEKFIGPDGTYWIRLSTVGRAFVRTMAMSERVSP